MNTLTHRAFFGDAERSFHISPELIIELERKTGVGVGAMCRRLFAGEFRHADVVETIRLALIGGGTSPKDADALIAAYAVTRPFSEVYSILYDIPRPYRDLNFEIGSSAPIPFWLNDTCHIIIGDADKEEPIKLFGANALRNPVLADISRLLDDARSGRISDRMREWAAENISNSFADVFHEGPSFARYWITRYRVALSHARRKAKPPHPIDHRLRQVAGDWLQRFGSKTDLSKLGGLLGSTADEVFSRRQITDMLFAFLVSKLPHVESKDIELYLREPTLHKAFPHGIYQYYLDNGWPRVPFKYRRFDDFTSLMMDRLSVGHEVDDYWPAAKLALLFYGRGPAPIQVEGLTQTYMNYVRTELDRTRREAKDILSDRKQAAHWYPLADAILTYYDQLMDLEGIIVPDDRMKREPYDNRFGISSAFLKDLKKVKRGEW